jgi:hypothetical protein
MDKKGREEIDFLNNEKKHAITTSKAKANAPSATNHNGSCIKCRRCTSPRLSHTRGVSLPAIRLDQQYGGLITTIFFEIERSFLGNK